MTKTLRNFTILLAVFAFACAPAFAQTVLTPTTLSAAITSTSGGLTGFTFTVASATGFVANTTIAIVDAERFDITGVSGTTITASRSATRASLHKSGALVWVGLKNQLAFSDNKQGACTRSNEFVLPHISLLGTPAVTTIFDCHGGQWVNGGLPTTATITQPFKVVSPTIGATLYTGINTNGTTLTTTTLYCTGVTLPSMLITTMGALAGSPAGTDKWVYYIYDASGGTALANTALAGATTGTASTFQTQNLATPYYAVAGSYHFCMQTNGTSDTARMAITGQIDTVLTKGQTSSVFGTAPSLTVPTTFTTATGPLWVAY